MTTAANRVGHELHHAVDVREEVQVARTEVVEAGVARFRASDTVLRALAPTRE